MDFGDAVELHHDRADAAASITMINGRPLGNGACRAVGVLSKKPGDVYAAALVRDPRNLSSCCVVTAAHVVHLNHPSELSWKLPGGPTYKVTQIWLPDGPHADVNNVATHDLALLYLAAAPIGVVPLGLKKSPPPPGSAVRFIGTGGTSDREKPTGRGARQYQDFKLALSQYGDGPKLMIGSVNDSGGPFIWNDRVFAVLHDQHYKPKLEYDTWCLMRWDH